MYRTPYRPWISRSRACALATSSAVTPRRSWRSMKIGMLRTPGLRRDASSRRADVLVHMQQIGGIVLLLHGRQAIVIGSVGGLDPRLALVVHHEVGVGALEVERMNGLPIVLRPLLEGQGFRRVGIGCANHQRPGRGPMTPRRRVCLPPVDGAVDRIKVHEGKRARQLGRMNE